MFCPSASSLTLTGATDSPADTRGSVTSNELLCGSRGPAEVPGDIKALTRTCAGARLPVKWKPGVMVVVLLGRGPKRESDFIHNTNTKISRHGDQRGDEVHGRLLDNAVHREFCLAANLYLRLKLVVKRVAFFCELTKKYSIAIFLNQDFVHFTVSKYWF